MGCTYIPANEYHYSQNERRDAQCIKRVSLCTLEAYEECPRRTETLYNNICESDTEIELHSQFWTLSRLRLLERGV